MSDKNTKRTWKEKVADFMQKNALYIASATIFMSGEEYVPYHR